MQTDLGEGVPPGSRLPSMGDETFLSAWTEDDFGRLMYYLESRRFRAGEVVIQAGESDSSLYIIVDGRLEVILPSGSDAHRPVLATLETGSVVGEQAFLDGQPRSAMVRAAQQGELLRLGREAFQAFASREPDLARSFLFDLARVLSLRLRRATARSRTQAEPPPMRIAVPLQRIQIDEEERARGVAEITNSSFFQELQSKTRRWRNAEGKSAPSD